MEIKYNNLYTHFVFTTSERYPCIEPQHRERIEKYITGIINNRQCKLYAVYANPEHIHFLVSRSPTMSEEELANQVAEASEAFINQNHLCNGRFHWQSSCSAFSVSKKDVDKVCKYILNQPEHHKTQSYDEEWETFLKFYQTGMPENKGRID
ncbi:MAG: IS200/IS605 family transposase [Planctomycetaceae bacterium]|jgi:REP element-mobilizing transposase RayT|nr:IS200/IS605 family transposase [Planctomycetaceae bacterium]